jgi:REP element-mobilizing transposase RayT
MAKKWTNQNLPGALHFLTGNVVNRIPVFKSAGCCSGFIDVLSKLVREWPAKLIAYVVMPDHFH